MTTNNTPLEDVMRELTYLKRFEELEHCAGMIKGITMALKACNVRWKYVVDEDDPQKRFKAVLI